MVVLCTFLFSSLCHFSASRPLPWVTFDSLQPSRATSSKMTATKDYSALPLQKYACLAAISITVIFCQDNLSWCYITGGHAGLSQLNPSPIKSEL